MSKLKCNPNFYIYICICVTSFKVLLEFGNGNLIKKYKSHNNCRQRDEYFSWQLQVSCAVIQCLISAEDARTVFRYLLGKTSSNLIYIVLCKKDYIEMHVYAPPP